MFFDHENLFDTILNFSLVSQNYNFTKSKLSESIYTVMQKFRQRNKVRNMYFQ